MAEERNLGVARAPEMDEDSTKAELQRRMEEARESITQTVSEIKDTVTNQYQSVRESVTEALDWREQYRKRPLAWSLGAMGVGFCVGYSLGGAIGGDRDEDNYEIANYPTYDETDAFERTGATPTRYPAAAQRSYASPGIAYAPAAEQSIAGGAYGSSEYAAAAPRAEAALSQRPSYSSGYEGTPEEEKPGLVERFKETRAYDRLQEEVSELGNRFMDELSNTARTVVLPALFNKIKEMVGVDLSGKPSSGGSSRASASSPSAQSSARPSTPSSSATSVGTGSGTSASASASSSPTASSGAAGSMRSELAGSANASAGGRESGGPQTNSGFGYDDRYERESQLYARSENKGFSPQPRSGESGTGTGSATDAAGGTGTGTSGGREGNG